MGDAKRKHEQVRKPIKLDRGQYFELRALLRDVEAAQTAAQKTVDAASQKAQAFMQTLGLKTTVNYALDDATTSLTEQ